MKLNCQSESKCQTDSRSVDEPIEVPMRRWRVNGNQVPVKKRPVGGPLFKKDLASVVEGSMG